MKPDTHYFKSQGIELAGTLVVPDNANDAAVLCITGGGEENCDHYYLEWQKFMAAEIGISSFAFSARGVGGSAGVFRTDSVGYQQVVTNVNSQKSRTNDTLAALEYLMKVTGIEDPNKIGIIGGSMGGDIALHALQYWLPRALVLRAPAAYPNAIHNTDYGPNWGASVRKLGEAAALESTNFAQILRLGQLGLSMQLIFSKGEQIIPGRIRVKYQDSVLLAGGEIVSVGDEDTKHAYVNRAKNPKAVRVADVIAKLITFQSSTEFFRRHLVSAE